MSENMNIEVIRSTQESLGKYVKKPPLSEKLLRKPPFRFLHDIVTAIIKNTGFFDELFSEEELNSENVKDREKKIAFLQKVIEVVNMVTNSSLSVRPSKIIAGQEPEKTNELLQQIGKALQQNLSSKEAVLVIKDKSGKSTVSTHQVKNTENNKVSNKNTLNVKHERPRKEISNLKTDRSSKDKSKTKVDPREKKTGLVKREELIKKEKKGELDSSNAKLKTLPTKRSEKNNSSRENDPIATVDLLTEEIKIETDVLENDLKTHSNKIYPESIENNAPLITADLLEKTLGPVDPNSDDVSLGTDSNKIVEEVSQIEPETQEQHESLVIDSGNDQISTDIGKEIIEKPNETSDTIVNENDEINSLSINNPESNTPIVYDKHEEQNNTKLKSGKKIDRIEPLKTYKNSEKKSDDESIEQKLSRSSNDSEIIKSGAKSRNLLRPPSVRPSSARPGAPRLRERATDVIIKTAEPTTVGKVNVIVENYDNPQEHDEEILVVIQDTLETNVVETNSFISEEISSGHGHLVQQILDTQKKLVHDDNAKTEIEWEYGARREREALYKEVDTIKVGLQSLSRAANPIGVLMDHVQEDVEVMRQELLAWRESYQSSVTALSYQQSLTEQEVQILLQKLKQLDASILEHTEQIQTVKLSIHRNSEKIKKLIDGEDNK